MRCVSTCTLQRAIAKILRFKLVSHKFVLEGVFVEGLPQSITQNLQFCCSSRTRAPLQEFMYYATWLSKMQDTLPPEDYPGAHKNTQGELDHLLYNCCQLAINDIESSSDQALMQCNSRSGVWNEALPDTRATPPINLTTSTQRRACQYSWQRALLWSMLFIVS